MDHHIMAWGNTGASAPSSAKKRKAMDSLSPRPARKWTSDFGDTVTVVVGKDDTARTFTVHRDLIIEMSPYFAAALSGRWTQEEHKPLRLPDHEAKHFQFWLEWLYQRRTSMLVVAQSIDGTIMKETRNDQIVSGLNFMINVWILGDFLGDVYIRNIIMYEVLKVSFTQGRKVGNKNLEMIAKRCPPHSTIYRWARDVVARSYSAEDLEQVEVVLPAQFINEVLKSLMRSTADGSLKDKPPSHATLEQYQEDLPYMPREGTTSKLDMPSEASVQTSRADKDEG